MPRLFAADLIICCSFASATGGPTPADPLMPSGHWTVPDFGDAPTPPMGWNSWNAFATEVDEAATPLSADVRGVRTIELVARQAGQDATPVVADWANAMLSVVP